MKRHGKSVVKSYSLVDFARGQLTCEESLEILGILEEDSTRSEELEIVLRMLEPNSAVGSSVITDDEKKKAGRKAVRDQHTGFEVIVRSAALAILVVGTALLAQEFGKPEGFNLLHVNPNDIDIRTRGEPEKIAEIAYALICEGENKRAMELVDWSLSALPEGDGRAHSHLLKGGLLLMKSEIYYLAIFSHFDSTLVRQGLNELDLARRMSGQRRVIEGAIWLSIKGNLMIGDRFKALEQIEALESSGGVRHAEASRLRHLLDDWE